MKERKLDPLKYICNHKNSDLFDEFLTSYQEDIKKIVGRHRNSFHKLSFEDVVSEANLILLKGKRKILEACGKDFDMILLKKVCFAYVKNAIIWSHYKEGKDKDYINKLDSMHHSHEFGLITTFDLSLQTTSKEEFDDFYENNNPKESSERRENLKSFFDVLVKYTYLLTDTEISTISYLKKGLNCYEIASEIGVTHQAVSASVRNLNEKISSHFNLNKLSPSYISKEISSGHKALNNFSKSCHEGFTKKDKSALRGFVIDNPSKFSCKEITSLLFESRYSTRQLSSYLAKAKLSNFVLKSKERKVLTS
jgi:RNA polymerase sigma factor (sigma-70 family)